MIVEYVEFFSKALVKQTHLMNNPANMLAKDLVNTGLRRKYRFRKCQRSWRKSMQIQDELVKFYTDSTDSTVNRV